MTASSAAEASWTSEAERSASFAAAIDAIRQRVERLDDTDVRYIRAMRRFARAMEIVGRLLLHFVPGPAGLVLGVLCLWVYRQLQVGEIGHTVLHGCFDGAPDATELRSAHFHWEVPVEESTWRHNHNLRHHQHTNVAGRDPDLGSSFSRYTDRLPHKWIQYVQVPILLFVVAPNFGLLVGAHYAGLECLLWPDRPPAHLADRDRAWVRGAHRRLGRKLALHYAKEYVLFPLLAWAAWPRVVLGNFLSAVLTNLYSAATNFSSHIGDDVRDWPATQRPANRGEFYRMQVEGTKNFEVSWAVSVLCGGLDRQIEHHLFPRVPPNRLRALGHEVRAVCEAHGVRYQTDTWPRTLRRVLGKLVRLSFPSPAPVAGAPPAAPADRAS